MEALLLVIFQQIAVVPIGFYCAQLYYTGLQLVKVEHISSVCLDYQ